MCLSCLLYKHWIFKAVNSHCNQCNVSIVSHMFLHFMVCWTINFLLFNISSSNWIRMSKKFNLLWRQCCHHKSKSVSCEADHGIHWVQNYCQGLFVAVWVWRVSSWQITVYSGEPTGISVESWLAGGFSVVPDEVTVLIPRKRGEFGAEWEF